MNKKIAVAGMVMIAVWRRPISVIDSEGTEK